MPADLRFHGDSRKFLTALCRSKTTTSRANILFFHLATANPSCNLSVATSASCYHLPTMQAPQREDTNSILLRASVITVVILLLAAFWVPIDVSLRDYY